MWTIGRSNGCQATLIYFRFFLSFRFQFLCNVSWRTSLRNKYKYRLIVNSIKLLWNLHSILNKSVILNYVILGKPLSIYCFIDDLFIYSSNVCGEIIFVVTSVIHFALFTDDGASKCKIITNSYSAISGKLYITESNGLVDIVQRPWPDFPTKLYGCVRLSIFVCVARHQLANITIEFNWSRPFIQKINVCK